jgi:hypothetical protein
MTQNALVDVQTKPHLIAVLKKLILIKKTVAVSSKIISIMYINTMDM